MIHKLSKILGNKIKYQLLNNLNKNTMLSTSLLHFIVLFKKTLKDFKIIKFMMSISVTISSVIIFAANLCIFFFIWHRTKSNEEICYTCTMTRL